MSVEKTLAEGARLVLASCSHQGFEPDEHRLGAEGAVRKVSPVLVERRPYLDIEAIRKTGDVVAGIRLSGSAEQPTTQIFSEPAMSQEQALSYLVLGRPLSTTGEDNNMLAQAALGLGLMGSAGVTSDIAKDLGIQDFELDTQGSGTNTAVVASGKISEKLSLRYGVGVFEPASTIALRYLLSKKVYLEVASGVASSLDIFYKRDF